MDRLSRAALRLAVKLTTFARSLHEPVNVGVDGVELFCPACKTGWPCKISTEHTERLFRLNKELAG